MHMPGVSARREWSKKMARTGALVVNSMPLHAGIITLKRQPRFRDLGLAD